MKILKALNLLAENNIIVMDRQVDMPLEVFREIFDEYDKEITNSPLFGQKTTYSTKYKDYTICAYKYNK